MKVLLVGNYVMDGQESMLRFSSVMERGLRSAGHQVQVCRPPVLAGRLSRPDSRVGKWLGHVDKFFAFRALLRSASRKADIVHICDHSNSFYVGQVRKQPHIVTCHDLLGIRGALNEVPLNRPGWTGRQLQRLILNGLTQAQHVACVSEATRSELLRVARVPEKRVSKVYMGLNYPYSPMAEKDAMTRIRAFGLDPATPFILHVGGNSWYKNRLGVLRIFAALRERTRTTPKLAMVGKPWTPELKSFVAQSGLGNDIREVCDADSEDLRAFYSIARIMLFPSLAEGFGWPIVEAQACGCVVVTSNRSPMDEVGGAAAVYVDPDDIEGAASTVADLLDRGTHCGREQSISNATRFSTARMIQSYVDLYERVVHERS